jgi:hypothetical protein
MEEVGIISEGWPAQSTIGAMLVLAWRGADFHCRGGNNEDKDREIVNISAVASRFSFRPIFQGTYY